MSFFGYEHRATGPGVKMDGLLMRNERSIIQKKMIHTGDFEIVMQLAKHNS